MLQMRLLPGRREKRRVNMRNVVRDWRLYTLLLPSFLLLLVFRYIPMGGIIIAFQDYNVFAGFLESPFVGLKHFVDLFHLPNFPMILRNTLLISFYKLLFGFPAPIILALALNEVRFVPLKRIAQNVFYLPHFMSWVIIAGLCFTVFSRQGPINMVVSALGGEPVSFLMEARWFRSVLVISDIWKESGWGTIIYLAALTSIDPGLYEAASIDGAGRMQQLAHITLPSLLPTIMVLLVLRCAGILNAGQDQILLMQNAMVGDVSEIIDTYVYKRGLGQGQYSFTTALGLCKSVVSMALLLAADSFKARLQGGE